jgi:hypothetical protein
VLEPPVPPPVLIMGLPAPPVPLAWEPPVPLGDGGALPATPVTAVPPEPVLPDGPPFAPPLPVAAAPPEPVTPGIVPGEPLPPPGLLLLLLQPATPRIRHTVKKRLKPIP